ncbi:MAG TPA: 2-C-methyl-D-erythritol 4-phosphate cytidylyltransferase [Syntrophorhabdaceae bacterium]|jgi:2-C-methyl-D-erythritol 4-phosphate cytidylyltransferase|nr:2-C-methyl-D-erythritol 4-phosphate cytidylyltransferase [Syntrophorhabdaceae bacterium]HNS14562.1 2-C-methyl-D-erythritol 4-phosphate cytidylyltransferase [Syntrophorhabdaceae bacterium]HNT68925.1 2-C-methyl-D-erythritol 4-phosphate cytidylyltransferase [Syntrophorhabdaceae bacterium]
MRTLAIILAGGAGKRMGAATNKQFLLIDNKPIIVHTLQIFEECRAIDGIYLVVNQKDLPMIQEEILETYRFNKILKLVIGGRLRQDSVRNGLEAIETPCDIVIIHDGARPFVSPSFIDKGIFLMEMFDAVIPALPVKDTIKAVSKEGFVQKTLERDSLWHVQTPQTFKYDLITKAYREGVAKKLYGYDDATFLEHMGKKVKVIEGSPYNIKITTPEDLIIARGMLSQLKGNL